MSDDASVDGQKTPTKGTSVPPSAAASVAALPSDSSPSKSRSSVPSVPPSAAASVATLPSAAGLPDTRGKAASMSKLKRFQKGVHMVTASLKMKLMQSNRFLARFPGAKSVTNLQTLKDDTGGGDEPEVTVVEDKAELIRSITELYPLACAVVQQPPRQTFRAFIVGDEEENHLDVDKDRLENLQITIHEFEIIVDALGIDATQQCIVDAFFWCIEQTAPDGDADRADEASGGGGVLSWPAFAAAIQLKDDTGQESSDAIEAQALRSARLKEAAIKKAEEAHKTNSDNLNAVKKMMMERIDAIQTIVTSPESTDEEKMTALSTLEESDSVLKQTEEALLDVEATWKTKQEECKLNELEERVLRGAKAMNEAKQQRKRDKESQQQVKKKTMERVAVTSTEELQAILKKERAMLKQGDNFERFQLEHRNRVKAYSKEFDEKREFIANEGANLSAMEDYDVKSRMLELDQLLHEDEESYARREKEFVENAISLTVEEQRVLRGYYATRKGKRGHTENHTVLPMHRSLPTILKRREDQQRKKEAAAAKKKSDEAAEEQREVGLDHDHSHTHSHQAEMAVLSEDAMEHATKLLAAAREQSIRRDNTGGDRSAAVSRKESIGPPASSPFAGLPGMEGALPIQNRRRGITAAAFSQMELPDVSEWRRPFQRDDTEDQEVPPNPDFDALAMYHSRPECLYKTAGPMMYGLMRSREYAMAADMDFAPRTFEHHRYGKSRENNPPDLSAAPQPVINDFQSAIIPTYEWAQSEEPGFSVLEKLLLPGQPAMTLPYPDLSPQSTAEERMSANYATQPRRTSCLEAFKSPAEAKSLGIQRLV